MTKSKQSLQESEDILMEEEARVKEELKATNELLNDATSKLHDALSVPAVNKQSGNVATMMLDAAKAKRHQAMESLEKIGKKKKLLTVKHHKLLKNLNIWPSKATVQRFLPNSFQEKYPKVRVIIHATEVKVEQPSSLVLQSELYSSYKSHCTLKGLVGIIPSGQIVFVSQLYTGSISDRNLVRSGFLNLPFEMLLWPIKALQLIS